MSIAKKRSNVIIGHRHPSTVGRYVLVTVFAAIWLTPIAFVVLTSLKSAAELSLRRFSWLPGRISLENYFRALSYEGYNWPLYFQNSLKVTLLSVVGSLFLNSLAGYAFARLRFRGRDLLFWLMLIGMMIPPQAIIIPQFLVLRDIPLAGGNDVLGNGGTGLLDTLWALVVPQLCGSFGIFLCRQFYLSFPRALDDAARIDGCPEFRIYWSIFLPQSTTILATLTILKSVSVWNDFFFPLIMTTKENTRTVQLALQIFKGSTSNWNEIMALTLVTILPIIVVFLFAQKHFIQSVVSSGMKN